MVNERLRSSIAAAGISLSDLAAQVQVDPKTVERWITTERVPHRTHRWNTARVLRTDEAYLWPQVVNDSRTRSASQAEFVALYPNRGTVPRDLWQTLVDTASEAIDILAYAALFLTDTNPDLPATLAAKARDGAQVRILLGAPDSAAVTRRGEEEEIGDGLASRVHLSMTYLAPAFDASGVEIRLHDTTLYNSLFRFDDALLVNTHAYGAPAAQSPVLHIHRIPGGRLFDHYLRSFDRVWNLAKGIDTVTLETRH